jgi:ribosomal protein L11 methyltransferase
MILSGSGQAFILTVYQCEAHEIVITPKMSFGTGHHATTYMVMKLMEELDFNGKTVFDFGTGTGILAILAEKLGAG